MTFLSCTLFTCLFTYSLCVVCAVLFGLITMSTWLDDDELYLEGGSQLDVAGIGNVIIGVGLARTSLSVSVFVFTRSLYLIHTHTNSGGLVAAGWVLDLIAFAIMFAAS